MSLAPQNELSYLGVIAKNPPNLIKQKRAPTAQDFKYPIGTLWVDQVGGAGYMLVRVVGQTASWDEIGAGNTVIATINNNAPIGGNYTLAGTAAQIAVAQTAGTSTFSLTGPYAPATYTNHGLLVGSAAASIRALGVGATGTLLSGVTGADPAFTASPSVTGSVTAGTTLTATLGAITATNGNLVLGAAGNKLVIATGANASVGTATLAAGGPGGTITVNTSAVTAASIILTSRNTSGGTLGNIACPSASIVPGVSFLITSDQADTSTVNWQIIN